MLNIVWVKKKGIASDFFWSLVLRKSKKEPPIVRWLEMSAPQKVKRTDITISILEIIFI
ncbi:hypothetical protein [Peribacillus sp. SCS-155]|uniref:hypothetical protein n=1 Tax=Peribacillus sedimenti TaxID=3115297 RepID=UPI003906551C